MSYALYIDDERFPKSENVCLFGSCFQWIICRSFDDAVKYILENEFPIYISFDHDLGIGKSGYDFAKWLIEMDMEKEGKCLSDKFSFNVHSANPIGKKNIEGILTSYFKYKNTK